jgi:hypothetical protein
MQVQRARSYRVTLSSGQAATCGQCKAYSEKKTVSGLRGVCLVSGVRITSATAACSLFPDLNPTSVLATE